MTDQCGQTGSRDHGHETDIPHRSFNENSNDEELYIDVGHLPLSVPFIHLSSDFSRCREPHEAGISIPLFIALPWIILKYKIWGEDSHDRPKNFLESQEYTPIDKPVPPASGCFVCQAVHFLQYSCKTFQEGMSYLLPIRQEVIFAVAREFNRRLRPKIFQISPRHLRHHTRFSYMETAANNIGFQFPLEVEKRLPGELEWEAIRMFMLEWTNGFLFLIRRDISGKGLSGHIGCFVWSHCIQILRNSLKKFIPKDPPNNGSMRTAYIDAIHDGYDVVIKHIKNMANAIVESAIDLERGSGEPRTSPLELRRQLLQACENFLTMNYTRCFMGVLDVERYIFHYTDHAETPDECLCRFYEKLKGESQQSLDLNP